MSTRAGTRRPCKQCRRPLVFAEGPNERVAPLQVVTTIYRITPNGECAEVVRIELPEGHRLAVSHFETCPHASRFSGANRRSAGSSRGRSR